MAVQPTNYSDGGLLRTAIYATIPDSLNTAATYNYFFKTLSWDQPVRAEYEYDNGGIPKAASYVRDFRTASGQILALSGVNAPAQMVKFAIALPVSDGGSTNVIITGIKFGFPSESVQTWDVEMKEVIN